MQKDTLKLGHLSTVSGVPMITFMYKRTTHVLVPLKQDTSYSLTLRANLNFVECICEYLIGLSSDPIGTIILFIKKLVSKGFCC